MANSTSESSSLQRKQKMIRSSIFLTLSPVTALLLGIFLLD
ncbi:MAG: hypothetical protein ACFFDP_07380 [Promethearchaeota archaeon]